MAEWRCRISAQIGTNQFAHAYDFIGNQTNFVANVATNAYTHNALNQLETANIQQFSILNSPFSIFHDLDGNLTNDSVFAYSYDAANRLASVSSNGIVIVANEYDYRNRRIRKTTPTTETTFVYDGWNLIHETVATISGGVTNTTEIQYFWGADLSEALQGAGGVGGLLAVSMNGDFYFPAYDNNGNIMKYIDESGNVVAAYEYNAYGKTLSQSGSMAEIFRHRFSTKYYDSETELYYYGYRFYSPTLMRWLNRDPIEERGGLNLYGFCGNRATCRFDSIGLTSVQINVGAEEKDSPKGFLNFIKIEATVIEPPTAGGKLNFIQLKKPANGNWSLDIQGTLGPYYYTLLEAEKYTSKNINGQDVLTHYDAPGGFLDKVNFYTAVVEVNRSCSTNKKRFGFQSISCYDRVSVLASVSWSFDPNILGNYQHSGKADVITKREAMIPTLQQLVNLSTWRTELCSSTRVEVVNGR